jgi:hypothetical protein
VVQQLGILKEWPQVNLPLACFDRANVDIHETLESIVDTQDIGGQKSSATVAIATENQVHEKKGVAEVNRSRFGIVAYESGYFRL